MWVQFVRETLSAKKGFYRAARLGVQRNSNASRASIACGMERMLLSHHATQPEFPSLAGATCGATNSEDLPMLIEQAIKSGRISLNNGTPGILAGAGYHRLANQVASHDPEQAAALGLFITPGKPPLKILCLLAGLEWAVCIVVALIALSSHDVEPGDEDGGGTTGGDDGPDGPWGGDGEL